MDEKKRRIGIVIGIAIALISLVRLAFLLPGIMPKDHEKALKKHLVELKSASLEDKGVVLEAIFKDCAELGPKSKFAEPDVYAVANDCYESTLGCGKPLGEHGFTILLQSVFAFGRMGELSEETTALLGKIIDNKVATEEVPGYPFLVLQASKATVNSAKIKVDRIMAEVEEMKRNMFSGIGSDTPPPDSSATDESGPTLTPSARKRIDDEPFEANDMEFQNWKTWYADCLEFGEISWVMQLDMNDPEVDWKYLETSVPKKKLYFNAYLKNLMVFDALHADVRPETRKKTVELFTALLPQADLESTMTNFELLWAYDDADPERLFEFGKRIHARLPKGQTLSTVICESHLVKHLSRLKDAAKKKRCEELLKALCDEDVWETYHAYLKP